MNYLQKITALSITLSLSACAVGPNYTRPAVNTPTAFKEAKNKHIIAAEKSTHWKMAQPKDQDIRGKWWLVFNDATLNQLEEQLTTSNQTIMNAYHNYQQARALVNEARASYFPKLTGELSLTRQKNNGGSNSTSSNTNTGSSIENTHSWLFDVSWEPDIWGAVRHQVESRTASAEASGALFASTRLSSEALLAQTYFQLRGLDAIQQLLNDTVISYQKTLKLTQNRYASGVAARGDILQAQSTLDAAQAQAINNGILRSQYEHAIAVLIGIPPAEFSLATHSLHAIPPTIPINVPSSLLERRPDIAQAERLIAQANAEIGVAIAAYFPTLTLSGSASSVTKGFGPIFSAPLWSWSLGAQAAETIFDGGARSATVAAAKEGYQATVANYRQVVLTAFQDVEDNLASLRILNHQILIEKKAVASAKLALKLVMNQYKSGTVDYVSVSTAQVHAFTAQQNALNVSTERMVSSVKLIKALGGGWEN